MEYKISTATDWVTVTRSGTTASQTVSSLTNGTAYNFRVSATNSAGTGTATSPVNATPATTPGVPASLDATAGNGQITLSWSAPGSTGGATITGYRVEWKLNTATSWPTASPNRATSTTTSHTFTGLTNGTAYNFRVSATNSAGTGTATSPVNATPAAAVTAPGAPTGLGATPGNTQVTLSWSAPSSNGGAAITGYRVEWKLSTASTWPTTSPNRATSTTTSHTFTGLTNGTAYNFRVSATNSAGTGTASSPVNATPATTPGVPASLGATAGNGQVTLSWNAPSSTGGATITGYRVEWKLNTASTWPTTSANRATSTTTSHTFSSLTNGTAYNFRVSATNSAGTGTATSPVNATPAAAATAPGAPTGLGATPGNTQVTLSWSAPSSNGGAAITGYRVEWKLSTASTWPTTSANRATSTTTSHTFTGLTNGTAYNFRVSATNSAGTGTATNAVNATPAAAATAPGAPTGLGATPGNTQVTLSWSAPSSNGGAAITGYRVEWKLSTASTWPTTSANRATSTTTSHTFTGLTNGTAYNFRVSATNSAGTGTATNAVNATPAAAATAPGAPTGLGATPGNTQVTLSWSAPSSNGGAAITGYRVEWKLSTASTWPTTSANRATSTTTSHTFTGLTNGTAYNFRVSATNSAGTGTATNAVNATPAAAATAPGAPTGLGATPGNGQVALSWTAPSSTGGAAISGYKVEYKISTATDWVTNDRNALRHHGG